MRASQSCHVISLALLGKSLVISYLFLIHFVFVFKRDQVADQQLLSELRIVNLVLK